jgi:hypothetical protein
MKNGSNKLNPELEAILVELEATLQTQLDEKTRREAMRIGNAALKHVLKKARKRERRVRLVRKLLMVLAILVATVAYVAHKLSALVTRALRISLPVLVMLMASVTHAEIGDRPRNSSRVFRAVCVSHVASKASICGCMQTTVIGRPQRLQSTGRSNAKSTPR